MGGDGSLKIIQQLATLGNSLLVGIPKTIDNDVAFTEHSIGFDTVINTNVDAINRLTFTAASHYRVMIVEVMGAYRRSFSTTLRDCWWCRCNFNS